MRALLVACALLLSACNGGNATRVFLTVSWNPDVALDQLNVHIDVDGALVAGPAFRPRAPAPEPLEATQSMRLLVPDDLGGKSVDVVIEGRVAEKVRGRGRASVQLVKGGEVVTEIVLDMYVGDCVSCEGCCEGGETCLPADAEHCGTGGADCGTCIPFGDACAAGKCACGDGPACARGQRCLGGTCVCDASSCPGGCCDKDVCVARALSSCGAPGNTCTVCNPITADSCSSEGGCRCGNNPACGANLHCSGGICICDGVSCPSGCCDTLGVCRSGTLSTACGAGGGACEQCPIDAISSNPQECVNGVCSGCAATCPDGCCSGSMCNPSNTDTCGTLGAACKTCSVLRADTCDASGACKCGMQPQCAEGQVCDGGFCVCNANSCPLGCCSARMGGVCLPGRTGASCGRAGTICAGCNGGCDEDTGQCITCNATNCPYGCCEGDHCREQGMTTVGDASGYACGIGAAACVFCDSSKADGCSSITGACTCGGGAVCGEGQACKSGQCVCDASTCANGCCDGNACIKPPSNTRCGLAGAACADCSTGRSNVCLAGACACGTGPACAAGQRCDGLGACVCDATSCPDGCCSAAGVCMPPGNQSDTSCGAGGALCQNCQVPENGKCMAGACTCKGDADSCGDYSAPGPSCVSCPAAQRCQGMACVCKQDDTSCGTAPACATCADNQDCLGGMCGCDAAHTCGSACCAPSETCDVDAMTCITID